MFLPDSNAHVAKHMYTHMYWIDRISHTDVPTVVRFGRWMEPVAMIETCPSKLGPFDMALLVCTAHFILNHTASLNNAPDHLTLSAHYSQKAFGTSLRLIQRSIVLNVF